MQVQFLTLTSGSEAPGHSSACSQLHLCNGELRSMRSFLNCVLEIKWNSDLTRTTYEFKLNLEKFQTKIKRMTYFVNMPFQRKLNVSFWEC